MNVSTTATSRVAGAAKATWLPSSISTTCRSRSYRPANSPHCRDCVRRHDRRDNEWLAALDCIQRRGDAVPVDPIEMERRAEPRFGGPCVHDGRQRLRVSLIDLLAGQRFLVRGCRCTGARSVSETNSFERVDEISARPKRSARPLDGGVSPRHLRVDPPGPAVSRPRFRAAESLSDVQLTESGPSIESGAFGDTPDLRRECPENVNGAHRRSLTQCGVVHEATPIDALDVPELDVSQGGTEHEREVQVGDALGNHHRLHRHYLRTR